MSYSLSKRYFGLKDYSPIRWEKNPQWIKINKMIENASSISELIYWKSKEDEFFKELGINK